MKKINKEIIPGWPVVFPQNKLQEFACELLLKAGYLLIPKWRLRNLYYYSYLIRLIRQYKISCVIDIGAHQGEFAEGLRLQAGYQGQIFSFEPVPEVFEVLQKRSRKYSNWEVSNCAISNFDGMTSIYLTHSSFFSSLMKPIESVVSEYEQSIKVQRQIDIKVKKLTSFLSLSKLELAETFLKCDTQGSDLKILMSIPEVLAQLPLVQVESCHQPYYEGAGSAEQINNFMQENNFSLANQFPVTYDKYQRIIEFDALYINNRLLQ